jgi:hypothetical protein
MNIPQFPGKSLLPVVLPFLLLATDTVHAQLEALAKTADLQSLSQTQLTNLYSSIVGGSVFQATLHGTVDTTPNANDTGVGPVFGLSGASLPVVAHILVDTARTGPKVTQLKGGMIGGFTLASDFIGYNAEQILAIYLVIGDPQGARKEIAYLNIDGLSPLLNPAVPYETGKGISPTAGVWLNGDLDTIRPDAGHFTLSGTGAESGNGFQIGTFDGGGNQYAFSSQIYIQQAGSNYTLGNLTHIEVENLSQSLATYLKDKSAAKMKYARIKKDVAKLKKSLIAAEGTKKLKLKTAYIKAKKNLKKAANRFNRLKVPF